MFQTNMVENIKQTFYVLYSLPENRAVYEITGKNVV